MTETLAVTPDYEIICVDGKPRALTLQSESCHGYGRFVALSSIDNGKTIALTDTSGKQLHLAHPDKDIDFSMVALSLTVFILTETGDTRDQFDIFLEF